MGRGLAMIDVTYFDASVNGCHRQMIIAVVIIIKEA